MSIIVPPDEKLPFQYWLRFEFGKSGNPHVHGQAYVAGNPNFDCVVQDDTVLDEMKQTKHPDAQHFRTVVEAEQEIATFFDQFVSETHPAKDPEGIHYYDLFIENLQLPDCAKPQVINMHEVLEDAFAQDEPDFTRLKQILVALIEDGQRHDYHGDHAPTLGVHACARKGKNAEGKTLVYCRYGYAKALFTATPEQKGYIAADPYRPDLRNLFLARNDSLRLEQPKSVSAS